MSKRKAVTTLAADLSKTQSNKSKKTDDESQIETKTNVSSGDTLDESVPKSFKGESFNLKIISWNVNGIRAALKKKALDFFSTNPCEILCLQETKCSEKTFPAELKNWKGFPFKYNHFSKKDGYAGVALLSKTKPISVDYGLKKSKHDQEGRVITAHFDKFIVVNTYTPNAGQGLSRLDYRINEWDKDFREYLKELSSKKPVILCGDLNVAHKEIDLENPKTNTKTAGFTPQERESFTQLLDSGFIDSYRALYPDKRQSYTFWSYLRDSRSKNIGWRLDYFVLSEHLKENLCDNRILSDILGSDHCPIALYLALN